MASDRPPFVIAIHEPGLLACLCLRVYAYCGGDLERVTRQVPVGHQSLPGAAFTVMGLLEPEWQEIVGQHGSDTPFRRWLAGQSPEYRRMIEETRDPYELQEALRRFKQGVPR